MSVLVIAAVEGYQRDLERSDGSIDLIESNLCIARLEISGKSLRKELPISGLLALWLGLLRCRHDHPRKSC